MPRKKKEALLDADNRKMLSVDEWVDYWDKEKFLASERCETANKSVQLAKEEMEEMARKLEEAKRQYENKQKEADEEARRFAAYMKLGRPADLTKTGKQLISVNVGKDVYQKLLKIKNCYYDGLSGYIRYLIDKDLEENYKKYIKWLEEYDDGTYD